jgi:hypothetical protein
VKAGMKKKASPEPVISPRIMELAKKSLQPERPAVVKRCAVCGAACVPLTRPQNTDDLCWVCRRLKISAWRDSDQQISAQE